MIVQGYFIIAQCRLECHQHMYLCVSVTKLAFLFLFFQLSLVCSGGRWGYSLRHHLSVHTDSWGWNESLSALEWQCKRRSTWRHFSVLFAPRVEEREMTLQWTASRVSWVSWVSGVEEHHREVSEVIIVSLCCSPASLICVCEWMREERESHLVTSVRVVMCYPARIMMVYMWWHCAVKMEALRKRRKDGETVYCFGSTMNDEWWMSVCTLAV